jgi:hypothetical protein
MGRSLGCRPTSRNSSPRSNSARLPQAEHASERGSISFGIKPRWRHCGQVTATSMAHSSKKPRGHRLCAGAVDGGETGHNGCHKADGHRRHQSTKWCATAAVSTVSGSRSAFRLHFVNALSFLLHRSLSYFVPPFWIRLTAPPFLTKNHNEAARRVGSGEPSPSRWMICETQRTVLRWRW